MTMYLIPTVTNGGSGKKSIVLEYNLVERKRDMRFKFCKENKNNIISKEILEKLTYKYSVKIKGNKIIMPNGDTAYRFGRELKTNMN